MAETEETAETVETEEAETEEAETARADLRKQQGDVREELGDRLFTLGNLARHLKIDPEGPLAQATLKYQRRFEWMEEALKERGQDFVGTTLDEMDTLWEEAKQALRS